jgi:hypothetical protein
LKAGAIVVPVSPLSRRVRGLRLSRNYPGIVIRQNSEEDASWKNIGLPLWVRKGLPVIEWAKWVPSLGYLLSVEIRGKYEKRPDAERHWSLSFKEV